MAWKLQLQVTCDVCGIEVNERYPPEVYANDLTHYEVEAVWGPKFERDQKQPVPMLSAVDHLFKQAADEINEPGSRTVNMGHPPGGKVTANTIRYRPLICERCREEARR